MPGATDLFEDDLLDLIFTNIAAPNVGVAAGLQPSATANNFHISLHTGNAISDTSTLQTDNESAYAGYAREAVPRNVSDWTVGATAGLVDNDNPITFTISTDGPETETDVGIGFAASGAGVLQIFASLAADLIVNNGVTPEFLAGALDINLE